MPHPSPSRCAALLTLLLLSVSATVARAAEVVTLRSGFTIACASREAVSPNTVRLHLRAGEPGAQNYMDVPLASIAAVEVVPDPVEPASRFRRPLNTAALLQSSGAAHNVNVALLASVVKAESAGNPRAVSRAGARGLMQLMPSTAAQFGVPDSFSPEGNLGGGSAYLDQLLTRYHENIALALAAYNAGPGAVDRYHGIPPFRETRLYVARVIREFNRLAAREGSTAIVAAGTALPQTASR